MAHSAPDRDWAAAMDTETATEADAMVTSAPQARGGLPRLRAALAVAAVVALGAAATLAAQRREPSAAVAESESALSADAGAGNTRMGCSNWASILLTQAADSDYDKCNALCAGTVGCAAFNLQPSACSTGEGKAAGACYIYGQGCEEKANNCWDLYYNANYTQPWKLTGARQGCSNWEELLLAQFQGLSVDQCGYECSKNHRCVDFNIQMSAGNCPAGATPNVGTCYLFKHGCDTKDNKCWDLYRMEQKRARKPHVLLILADDMGHANIGYHRVDASTAEEKQGQKEVMTPHLDELAYDGVRLERHYAYKICGPSRAALISGRYGPHVMVKNSAATSANPNDPVSGYNGIPRNMTGFGVKLQEGGYRTHYVGKWDAGMATPQHTPRGRGFDTSLIYFQHANGYWNKKDGIESTGDVTICLNAFFDIFVENDTYRGPFKGPELSDSCENDTDPTPPCYEESIFEQRSMDVIRNHDASDKDHPLFLMHAFHLLHTPLQVPSYWYDKVDELVKSRGGVAIGTKNRRLIMAMTLYLDTVAKNLTQALIEKDMYEDTLIVFTSDNGGPIYEPGSSNNYPLKGGKYSDYDGGHRTNTFISGGYIPFTSRGSVYDYLVSNADWYYIFSELAGVDPTDFTAEAANPWLVSEGLPKLPAIDGVPGMLDAIIDNRQKRNNTLFLSQYAFLDYPWKLVTGTQPYSAHQGPLYPNCSTVESYKTGNGPEFVDLSIFGNNIDLGANWSGDCTSGCLYKLDEDPGETTDLASQYPGKLSDLMSQLVTANQTLFLPDRGDTNVTSCYSLMYNSGGHYGPFDDIETYYTQPPRTFADLTPTEQKQIDRITEVNALVESHPNATYQIVGDLLNLWGRLMGDTCCAVEIIGTCDTP